MKSGQSSSTSCPMFRMAEMTWLQGLSRCEMRADLLPYLLMPNTDVGSSLTPPAHVSASGPRLLKIFSLMLSCSSMRWLLWTSNSRLSCSSFSTTA